MAPPGNEYSVGGGGKLKLKGGPVQDGRIEKKKKKKERKKEKEKEKDTEKENTTSEGAKEPRGGGGGNDENDMVGLDHSSAKDDGTDSGGNIIERRSRSGSAAALSAGEATGVGKTDTEKRYEEVRKKRVREDRTFFFFF